MQLNPIDIEGQEFQRTLRGYDQDAVRVFLSRIAHQLSLSLNEREQQQRKISSLEAELSQLKSYEGELRDALLSLDQVSRSLKGQAEREAELIIKEAELRAEQIIAEGRAELIRMREEQRSLERQRERSTVELRALLESHLQMLDNRESTRAQAPREVERSPRWGTGERETGDALKEAQALSASLAIELEDEPSSSLQRGAKDDVSDAGGALDEALLNETLTPPRLTSPPREPSPVPFLSSPPASSSSSTSILSTGREGGEHSRPLTTPSNGSAAGVMSAQNSGVAALKEILARSGGRRGSEGSERPRGRGGDR